jgi:ATP-dependent RNA helicase SUPV3L1/SUV3
LFRSIRGQIANSKVWEIDKIKGSLL